MGGFTVAAVVPADHIDFSPEEEVEPVGVGVRNLLLIDQRVRVAHNYGWFGLVFLSLN